LAEEIGKIRQFSGLNVTTPFKEAILAYCDHLSPEVKAIGACNTLLIKNEQIIAYNTDCDGFYQLLKHNQLIDLPKTTKLLLIGAGGAAKAAYYVLNKLGYQITVTNRTATKAKQITESTLDFDQVSQQLPAFDLVINTTTVGVNHYLSPIVMEKVKENSVFIDLNYQTTLKFLDDSKALGAKTINGLEMLIYQAAKSYEIWFQEPASIEAIEAAIRRK
jgi:shikimate dehydrogenase